MIVPMKRVFVLCLEDEREAALKRLAALGAVQVEREVADSPAIAAAFEYAGQVAEFALRLINPAHTMEVVGQSSSIVGMSVMASEAASAGVFDLLLVVAAISMSLGFMNLLPLPPLDGGKILFELIQLVTGKPVSVKVQNIVSYVGLALLLALFLFVLKNDIVRYFM